MTAGPDDDIAREVGTSRAAARMRAAALELFAEKGYGATSTRDIAARLGLSPGAVYPHYKTKESLLYAISLEGHLSALAAITRPELAEGGPAERLRATVTAYAEWHARNHALARVGQYELNSLSGEHHRRIILIRRRTMAVLTDILRAGQQERIFDLGDIDTAVVAISSLCVDISRWFPSQRQRDPAELAARYAELVMHMVGSATP